MASPPAPHPAGGAPPNRQTTKTHLTEQVTPSFPSRPPLPSSSSPYTQVSYPAPSPSLLIPSDSVHLVAPVSLAFALPVSLPPVCHLTSVCCLQHWPQRQTHKQTSQATATTFPPARQFTTTIQHTTSRRILVPAQTRHLRTTQPLALAPPPYMLMIGASW